MALKHFGPWSIRRPLPRRRAPRSFLLILGWVSFLKLPVTRLPRRRHSRGLGRGVPVSAPAPPSSKRRSPSTSRTASRGVEGVAPHRFADHRRAVRDDDPVRAGDQYRSRASNDHQGCGVTRAPRPNLPAETSTASPLGVQAGRSRRPADRHLRPRIAPGKTPERLSWFVDDVVKRPAAGACAGGSRRSSGIGRRRPRDPGLARCRSACRRSVSPPPTSARCCAAPMSISPGLGAPKSAGRDQAIRTARWRQDPQRAVQCDDRAAAGGARFASRISASSPILLPPARAPFARTSKRRSRPSPSVSGASKGQERRLSSPRLCKKEDPTRSPERIRTVELKADRYRGRIHQRQLRTRRCTPLFEGAALAVHRGCFLFLPRTSGRRSSPRYRLPLSIFSRPSGRWISSASRSNLVSFLAITLSTGILVDDAIVEIENIVRPHEHGQNRPIRPRSTPPTRSALAVIAISPEPSSRSSRRRVSCRASPGQFFKQFGITVSVQVLFLAARCAPAW